MNKSKPQYLLAFKGFCHSIFESFWIYYINMYSVFVFHLTVELFR
jgi:hypothetical protein